MTGIKVSLDNNDATKAELSGLAVNSDIANLQVLVGQEPPHYGNINSTFTTNVAAGSTINIVIIAHGFGFIPASMMNWQNLSNQQYGTGRIDLDVQSDAYYIGYADVNNFYINFVKTGSSSFDTTNTSFNFRYYIFASPGA